MDDKQEAMPDDLPSEEATQSGDVKTLAQLAKAHGQLQGAPVAGDEHLIDDGKPVAFKWKHLAAASRHGWNSYEHQTGRKVMLSDADYLAAIECAYKYKEHPPANLTPKG